MQRATFRKSLLAVAVAGICGTVQAGGTGDIEVLRKEIRELREMNRKYEERLQQLEKRLVETEGKAAQASAPAPASVATARTAPSQTAYNPEISLILQGRYLASDFEEKRIPGFLAGGHDEGSPRGFSLDHTELVMSASVDPYFRGYLNLAIADEEVALEEAWFQTLGLGFGLTLKGGRFLSGIGYVNQQHPHAWDFADQNLAYQAMFGESYINDGLQLKWIAPASLLVELGFEAGRGSSFPGSDTNDNGFGSWSVFAHVGGDVGESHSWRAGASFLTTDARDREAHTGDVNEVEAETLFTGDSKIWGLDFVWKWAPDGNPKERNFKFQAEYLKRDEDGELTCADNSADGGACTGIADAYSSAQSGWYAQAVYQFMPRWRVGYRYDRLDPDTPDYGANNDVIERPDHRPYRHTAMADYSPSEFSRLRLQYTRDETMQDTADNVWVLQYIMSLGAHGAHKF